MTGALPTVTEVMLSLGEDHPHSSLYQQTIYVTLEPGASTATEIVTQTPDDDAGGTVTVDVYVTPTETGTVYVTKDCDTCEEKTYTSTATIVVTPQAVTKTCYDCDDQDDQGGHTTTITGTGGATATETDDDDDAAGGGAGAEQSQPQRTCAPGDEHEKVDYGPLRVSLQLFKIISFTV